MMDTLLRSLPRVTRPYSWGGTTGIAVEVIPDLLDRVPAAAVVYWGTSDSKAVITPHLAETLIFYTHAGD